MRGGSKVVQEVDDPHSARQRICPMAFMVHDGMVSMTPTLRQILRGFSGDLSW